MNPDPFFLVEHYDGLDIHGDLTALVLRWGRASETPAASSHGVDGRAQLLQLQYAIADAPTHGNSTKKVVEIVVGKAHRRPQPPLLRGLRSLFSKLVSVASGSVKQQLQDPHLLDLNNCLPLGDTAGLAYLERVSAWVSLALSLIQQATLDSDSLYSLV